MISENNIYNGELAFVCLSSRYSTSDYELDKSKMF